MMTIQCGSLELTTICNPGVEGSYSLSYRRYKDEILLLDFAMRGTLLLVRTRLISVLKDSSDLIRCHLAQSNLHGWREGHISVL